MTSVTDLASVLQELNSAEVDELARASGFVQRCRKFSGRSFVQTVVMGWLHNPASSLSELSSWSYLAGKGVSRQGVAQRFNAAAAVFLQAVLEAWLQQWVGSEAEVSGVVSKFRSVHVVDSSQVELPQSLVSVWAGGSGHSGARAALKLNVDWDLVSGGLQGLELSAGRQHDQRAEVAQQVYEAGSVRLTDSGYWSLQQLAALSRQHVGWVIPLKADACVYDEHGHKLEWLAWLTSTTADQFEANVYAGKAKLPCRLCARRLSPEAQAYHRAYLDRQTAKHARTPSPRQYALCGWLVVITNLAADHLSLAEVFVLARLRWQIEKLFDIWKSDGGLDQSRSHQPWRQLCEVYAKLLALLIQHWCSLLGVWQLPDRSLRQAYRVVRDHASLLLWALSYPTHLATVLTYIQSAMLTCRMTARRKKPHTYQLLAQPDLIWSLP
ncbi:MAG: IS4 family transposase [Anaerolineae bacterium]|nr:IS4 family transposase [Anaerolineae bacterium]